METALELRFAFDLGTNSIGWAVYQLGERTNSLGQKETDVPVQLVDLGANLFSDGRAPNTGESLAALRRVPRGARRRRDRYLQRRKHVLNLLQQHQFLPTDENELARILRADPYPIRATAAEREVSLYELGRALFHLSQRRGFKSNRKAPAGDEETSGKIATAAQNLQERLHKNGYLTLGQFLAARQSNPNARLRQTTRVRLSGAGVQSNYEFYPLREMVEAEFNVLWNTQSAFHAALTDEVQDVLRHAIFFQRPLAPVEPGRCTFFPDELRLSDATEAAQEFRIYQMVNNLRIIYQRSERCLSLEERDRIADVLVAGETLTWTKVRKLLGIDSSHLLNLQEGGEKELKGNRVANLMQGTKKKPGPFRDEWHTLSEIERREVIACLKEADNDEEVVAWAQTHLCCDEDKARLLAAVRLPDDYRRLSEKAVDMILDRLKTEVITYAEAVEQCGLHHSDLGGGEHYQRLPPYNKIPSLQRFLGRSTGDPDDPPDLRFGRIANPTVHIGLNQLRRTCNALIDRYGTPSQIVVELARELKQSEKQKKVTQNRIKENREKNDERRERLVELKQIEPDQKRIGETLLRLQLWDELGDLPRLCPYTGQPISITSLFSSNIEIEHILPFSRTLDNSPANKTVAFRKANRLKANLSPSEAATRHPDVIDRKAMQDRVRLSGMPANKRWRFEDDAMERYENEEQFLARQLNETQYLSRLARAFLSTLFASKDETGHGRQNVWVVPGRMTSLLRNRYAVNLGTSNRKSRDDHRHHAIDAAVIGVLDRSLIQRIASISAKREADGVDRLLADLEPPYPAFREQILNRVNTIHVSNRARHLNESPDSHHTSGKLHEETYYGIVKDLPENEEALSLGNVVRRKSVVSLTVPEISQIRDGKLRGELQKVAEIDPETRKTELTKKAVEQKLVVWSEQRGIYRIRVMKKKSTVIPIASRKTGEPYKAVVPDENAYFDIYKDNAGKWYGIAVNSFHANQKGVDSELTEGVFIMRVYKGDYLQLRDLETGFNAIKRVTQIKAASNLLVLVGANEAGNIQQRHDDDDDELRKDFANIAKLKSRAARRVRFTNAGRMKTVPHGKI